MAGKQDYIYADIHFSFQVSEFVAAGREKSACDIFKAGNRAKIRWFLRSSYISLLIYFVLDSDFENAVDRIESIFIVRMEQLEQWYYQLIKKRGISGQKENGQSEQVGKDGYWMVAGK